MKAKKIVGLIVCVGACASFSAFANTTNDWFSVGVSAGDITRVNCETNNATVEIEGNKIVIDNDLSTKFSIVPNVGLSSTNSTDIAKIDVVALLTPSSTNDFPAVDGAKAGFAVGVDDQNATNYYGFANGAWSKLAGGNPAKDSDTTFSIIINYRDNTVDFVADNVALTPQLAIAAGSSFTAIDAFGSGTIASVNSKFEVAEVAVGTAKYGSVAEAIAHEGTTANIKGVSPAGVVSESNISASGLPYAVCAALALDPAVHDTVKVVPAEADANTSNITFTMDPDQYVEPGVVVKFAIKKAGTQVGELADASEIKIPLSEGTGVYTIEPAAVVAQ